jgi:RNA polymerase sigma factor (sigma-70 family)
MIECKKGFVERQLEVLWTSGTLTGLSDAQLLCRFTDAQGATAESAFAELIDRHGPMVRGVCQQILRHSHDADDAFQATFLVLVRKARSIQVRESLAPWLYGVAYRTAQRARATASRYRQEGVEQVEALGVPPEDSYHLDLRPLLHEELDRLPDKYRAPIVLCHLEGKTHEQAAQLLHWPVGTVSGRLSRGRELLKSRLERRGLAVPSVIFSASSLNLAQSVPKSLIESTLIAATRFAAAQSVSNSVLSLAQGVLRIMFLNKLKTVSLALLLFGAVTSGVGVWARWTPGAAKQPDQGAEPELLQAPDKPASEAKAADPRARAQPEIMPGLGGGIDNGFPGVPMYRFMGGTRPKNSPNLMGSPSNYYMIKSSGIVVVESPDRTAMQAMSLETDLAGAAVWQRLAVPAGITATPIVSNDTMALMLKGKTIDQIAAFSAYTGEWRTQNLLKPAEELITPVIGPGSALYQVGNDFYAFSAKKGTWGVLHLEAKEEGSSTLSPTDVSVVQGNRLYIFGLKQGEWSKGVEMRLLPPQTNPKREELGKGFSRPARGAAAPAREPVPE